jgi:hypothetical protein
MNHHALAGALRRNKRTGASGAGTGALQETPFSRVENDF